MSDVLNKLWGFCHTLCHEKCNEIGSPTLKGSQVYRNDVNGEFTTPKGSNISHVSFSINLQSLRDFK